MAFVSLRDFFAQVAAITPDQFEEWNKAWKVAVENGSQESLLGFIGREKGIAEDVFMQQLAGALNWPYLDLGKLAVSIPFSEAGVTVRETKDLWDLPLVFLVLLLLRFSEWWLRRKWGIV